MAKITKNGTKFFISDLNSTNGTFRNGLRLLPNETVSIEPGDEIGLGNAFDSVVSFIVYLYMRKKKAYLV